MEHVELEEQREPEQEEREEEQMEIFVVEYRACFNCSIILSFSKFLNHGCPNCEMFMKFQLNLERVIHCSTADFRSLFRMYKPFKKWKSRFRPLEIYAPGLYASQVNGKMPRRYVFQLFSEDDYFNGEYHVNICKLTLF